MIIWGSTTKQKQLSQGNFFCPQCLSDASFKRIRYSRYFTLYFIPLFETKDLGVTVQCDYCQAELEENVLNYSKEQLLSAMQPWECVSCHALNASNRTSCLSCQRSRFGPPAFGPVGG